MPRCISTCLRRILLVLPIYQEERVTILDRGIWSVCMPSTGRGFCCDTVVVSLHNSCIFQRIEESFYGLQSRLTLCLEPTGWYPLSGALPNSRIHRIISLQARSIFRSLKSSCSHPLNPTPTDVFGATTR